jgi:hypothetical protein
LTFINLAADPIRRLALHFTDLPMTFNSRSRRKRSTAVTMLVVWLLALVTGVANACLLEPRGEHAVQSASHEAGASHKVAKVAGHYANESTTPSRSDHQSDKAPCQKSCEESAQTLLKPQPKVDVPDLQAIAHPIRAWLVDMLHPSRDSSAIFRTAIPPPSPPLRVSLSRLAL